MISAIDIAWIAGLLEGEGCFMHRRNGDLVVEITMTDCDIIDRIHALLKCGARKERQLPSGKTAYGWSLTNQRQAAGLMMTLLSLMGERRAAKIKECLKECLAKPLPQGQRTHCSHGHPLSGDNLRIFHEGKYTKRRCRACGGWRQRKYRETAILDLCGTSVLDLRSFS